jgi:hypothetical protein
LCKGSTTTAQNDILFYNIGKTAFPEMLTNNYVTGLGNDTTMSLATFTADSVKRIAKNSNQTYVIKKVLTDADTSSSISPFVFNIPTPLACEAGKLVGASVTFKSGNPWIPNVDTVSKLNHFIGVFSEEFAGQAQEYRGNAPDFDRNMSGSMFSFAPDTYYPSFMIEMFNTTAVGTELAWIDYHLTCTSCFVVNTNDIVSDISVTAMPNPANSLVNISMNLKESAKNVTIEISNALGQVVKTVYMGAVNAGIGVKSSISISELRSGLYIYTVNADGKKYSNKLMVN